MIGSYHQDDVLHHATCDRYVLHLCINKVLQANKSKSFLVTSSLCGSSACSCSNKGFEPWTRESVIIRYSLGENGV